MKNAESIINLKLQELHLFKKTISKQGRSHTVINAKIRVLNEILKELLK